MDVLAIGHFARVFDAEVFQLIAHDLQEMIVEYGLPYGPSCNHPSQQCSAQLRAVDYNTAAYDAIVPRPPV